MTDWFHPSLILLAGGLLLPFFKGMPRKFILLMVPTLVFINVWQFTPHGTMGVLQFMDWELTFGRVDRLSQVFAYIMSLMCIIGTLYSLHVEDDLQHIAAWFYVAGSLGVIYAGDYLVLFLFWELMAFASVFLVWFRKSKNSTQVGFRYLLIHTLGGLILLGGFMLRYQAVGDLTFDHLDISNPQLYTYLILIGFLLNAAVPPLHSWLPDAYSEATVTGAVFMCAFTTKTAIYALARGFSGMEILIPLGVVMAVYGIIYAILQNDCRRLLSWEIISQVGYMVVGVGIGTELAINGTCAHAFAHILYKSLLFMGCGAVLHMTGESRFSNLGGLYKKMPKTFVLTLMGGLAISAFPFFSGFVTKSMIIAAGFNEHLLWVGFLLSMVSAGTFLLTGLKIPYFIFFGENRCSKETMGRAGEPPWNMLTAMGIAAFLCVLIGSYTPYLYSMLPYPVEYHPYNAYHLSETMQLLLFTGLAFYLLRSKLTPVRTITLDIDWFYRMAGRGFFWLASKPIQFVDSCVSEAYRAVGLVSLMGVANFWSWFDWHAIDGVVDGVARSVRNIGGGVRQIQRGKLQYNILWGLSFLALMLIVYLLG